MDISIESLPRLPQGIIDAYERRELAVFVGAGISRLMGCQGWNQMADSLIENVCTPATAELIISYCQNSREKITIAKRMAEKDPKKEKVFWEIFHSAIKPKPKCEDIYSKIALLNTLFLTTNCDGLLVDKFPYSNSVDCTREMYSKHANEPFVFCLHGNWGEGTKREKERLIFTEDKYLSAYQPGNPLPDFLRTVMYEKTVLFIGYGLNEFEIINAGFEPPKQKDCLKHYVLEGFYDFQKELCNAKAEYFASINVNLIAFRKDEGGYYQQAKIISQWIDELKGKTSYNSRGVLEITSALDDFTEANKCVVEQKLSRTDSLKDSFLTAMLEVLPRLQICYSWILFLFDKSIFTPEDVPSVRIIDNRRYMNASWPILPCLLTCLKNREPSDFERKRIIEFVQKSIWFASHNEEIQKNETVVTLLWEVYLSLGMNPEKPEEIHLWKEWASNSNSAIYTVEDEYCEVIIQNASDNVADILSAFFAPGKKENQKQRAYWLKQLALKICSFHNSIIIGSILESCVSYLFSELEPNRFYQSTEDRFRFDRDGYVYALLESIKCFLSAINENDQTRIISKILQNANSTDQLQVALHLAAHVSKGSVDDFINNPLNKSNVFVDFYFWLNSRMQHFDEREKGTIQSWIQEASFGYNDEHDGSFDVALKWKNTWRFLLFDLLSTVEENAKELRDAITGDSRFNVKSPLEDTEYYYTIRDIPKEHFFEGADFSNNSTEEIYEAYLGEKKKSIWGNEYYHNVEILEKLVTVIDDKQLYNLFTLLLKSTDEQCAVATLLSQDATTGRFKHEELETMVRELYQIICEKDDADKYRNQLTSSFVDSLKHLDKNNWGKDEIVNLIMSLDADMLFRSDEPYHTDMDIVMNTINIAESRYYSLAIDCAVYCKQNETLKNQFFEWIKRALNCKQKRKWLVYACAFQIQNLLYLDKEQTNAIVFPAFDKSENPERLALLMCYHSSVIIPTVVAYISKESRIESINELIRENKNDYRNACPYITYMVAAYSFGYLETSNYNRFIKLINESDISHVAWTIFEGIKGIQNEKCWQLVDETLIILTNENIKAQFAKGVIIYSSRNQELTESYWKRIKIVIPYARLTEGIWYAIKECLEKTDKDNPFILEAIEEMTKASELMWEYEADEIIMQLFRLNSLEAIKRLCGYLIEKNINPGKYCHIGESPEKALEYLKSK